MRARLFEEMACPPLAAVSKKTVDGWAALDIGDSYAFNVAQFGTAMTKIPGALFSASFSVFLSTILSMTIGQPLSRFSTATMAPPPPQ